jgi:hypothetical protein
MTGKGDLTLEVLIPVFNDWDAVAVLLPRIDAVLGPSACSASAVTWGISGRSRWGWLTSKNGQPPTPWP